MTTGRKDASSSRHWPPRPSCPTHQNITDCRCFQTPPQHGDQYKTPRSISFRFDLAVEGGRLVQSIPARRLTKSSEEHGERNVQLLVLGMHRSGTSAAARILNLLGCHFAPESLAVGANDENPKGFWERLDVVELNDSMLQGAGAEWHSPLGFDPLALPEEEAARFTSTADLILRDLDKYRPWFIKDPRLCLTLPLWQPLLEAPLAVHVLRHPLEVAASLQARNALPIPVGLALWEIHVRLALAESAAWPRVLVSHRQLITAPVPTAVQLLQHLQAAGVAGLRMPEEQEITDFVTPTLHRQRADRDDLRHWAEAPQVRLYHRLEADITALDNDPLVFTWEAVRALSAHEAARVATVVEARLVETESRIRDELRRESHAIATGIRAELDKARQLREELTSLLKLADLCREHEQGVLHLEQETADLVGRLAKSEREADNLRRDLAAGTLSFSAHAAAAKVAKTRFRDLRQSSTWRLAPEVRSLWETFDRMLDNPDAAISRNRELVARSGFFDRDWYLATYADIAAVDIDALDHYLRWGGAEGRNPGPAFDSTAYLLAHPEIAESGINPLVHYLQHVGEQDGAAATNRQAA